MLRALLLTLATLLLYACSASAEGAWVLWTRHFRVVDNLEVRDPWEVYAPAPSHTTRKECETNLDVARTTHAGLGFEFSCLPDTVDPRGPKGAGR